MVDLIVDVAFVDLLLLMNISKKVYEAKLIASTYLKILDVKVQYCIGREFLPLAPLEYKRGSNCQVFEISLYQIFQKYCFRSFVAFKR